MKQIKVLLADDKEIFREGLARILDEQEQIEVVSKCSNGLQAIEKTNKDEPDVVLMDTKISQCGSTEAMRHINESCPGAKVAMLTDSENEEDLFSAIEAGATGYLVKDMKVGDLVKCIDLIANGEVVVSPPLAGKLVGKIAVTKAKGAKAGDNLSGREAEILQLLARGATNKEIAKTLFITQNTAKVHVKHILEKLKLRNRQQAAAYAIQQGLATEVTDVPQRSV
jgi:two-component system nitrate/nitrite response regulator NarL